MHEKAVQRSIYIYIYIYIYIERERERERNIWFLLYEQRLKRPHLLPSMTRTTKSNVNCLLVFTSRWRRVTCQSWKQCIGSLLLFRMVHCVSFLSLLLLLCLHPFFKLNSFLISGIKPWLCTLVQKYTEEKGLVADSVCGLRPPSAFFFFDFSAG